MSSKYDKQSRRQFLISAGGFTLSLPLLPSLLSKEAFASVSSKKRYVNFSFGHNMMKSKYIPSALANIPTGNNGAKELILSQYSGDIGEAYNHSVYRKLKQDGLVTMVGGLDCMAYLNGHGRASSTTAQSSLAHSGPFYESIDSFLEQSSILYPTGTAPQILRAIRCEGSAVKMLNRASGSLEKSNFAAINGYIDPKILYNDLFGTFTAPDTTSGPGKNLKLLAVQKIHETYKSTRASRKISSADKLKLDEHISNIRDIEITLEQQDNFKLGCSVPAAPTGNTKDANYYNDKLDMYLDLMALALKCGLSNVFTHGFLGHAERGSSIPGLHSTYFLHNDIFHNTPGALNNQQIADYYVIWKRFYLNKVAQRFLAALDVEEGTTGKTYLENSLVLISNESGVINDGPHGHSNTNYLPIMFGNLGGFLKSDRFLQFPRQINSTDQRGYGFPLNEFMNTILMGLGHQMSDVKIGSAPGFGIYGVSRYDDLYSSTYGKGIPEIIK